MTDRGAGGSRPIPPEWISAIGGERGPVSDAAAAAELYERYYGRLVRVCERYTGDRHLAEDAAQEALLRAIQYFDRYDPARPVWPWLRAIAVRVAQRDTNRTAHERSTDMTEIDAVDEADPPGRSEQWMLLAAALAALPARHRSALVVRYVSDWSSADAARLFGMDSNAFEQLLWRARRRLAAEYTKLVSDGRDEG